MRTFVLSLIIMALVACSTESSLPDDINPTGIILYKTPDGRSVESPKFRSLKSDEVKLIKHWLGVNQSNWATHRPMATLLPDWCVELFSEGSGEKAGLCRYGSIMVLRYKGEFMEIREAKISELEEVLALYDEYERQSSPWPSKELQKNIFEELESSGGCVIIALLESSVVGTCTLNLCKNFSWSGRPYAIIENVIVAKSQRNKGVGKALLNYATNSAEKKGCYKVALMTGSKEESTLKFYQSAGFLGNKVGFQRRFNA